MDFKDKIAKVFGGKVPNIFQLNVDGILNAALSLQGFSTADIFEPIRIDQINFSILIQDFITGLNTRLKTDEEKKIEEEAVKDMENVRRKNGILFRSQLVEVIQDKELDVHSKIGYCTFMRNLLQAYQYIYRADWVDNQNDFVQELYNGEIHYKKEYNLFLEWKNKQALTEQPAGIVKPIWMWDISKLKELSQELHQLKFTVTHSSFEDTFTRNAICDWPKSKTYLVFLFHYLFKDEAGNFPVSAVDFMERHFTTKGVKLNRKSIQTTISNIRPKINLPKDKLTGDYALIYEACNSIFPQISRDPE